MSIQIEIQLKRSKLKAAAMAEGGETCCISGRPASIRVVFDGEPRPYCCRTCKTTDGKLHGQACDAAAAIVVKRTVVQAPLMKPQSPREDTGPRRKQTPLRHDPHAAAMTEWKWYDAKKDLTLS